MNTMNTMNKMDKVDTMKLQRQMEEEDFSLPHLFYLLSKQGHRIGKAVTAQSHKMFLKRKAEVEANIIKYFEDAMLAGRYEVDYDLTSCVDYYGDYTFADWWENDRPYKAASFKIMHYGDCLAIQETDTYPWEIRDERGLPERLSILDPCSKHLWPHDISFSIYIIRYDMPEHLQKMRFEKLE